MKVVEIKNLDFQIGDKKILENFNLEVNEGDLVALIGASGAGKSTVLNFLIKNNIPNDDVIKVFNKDINEYKDRKNFAQKVGIIRQQFDLINELGVVNNVLAGRLNEWGLFKSIRSLVYPVDLDRAMDALEAVGLESRVYDYPAQLSGGEQQRIAIARILVQDPDIILADEPISALDPKSSDSIMSILTDLVKEKNKTLIASMHSVEHVKRYFDIVVGIKDGGVLFRKKTSELTEEDLISIYNRDEDYD